MARSWTSLGRQLGSIAAEQVPRLVAQAPKLTRRVPKLAEQAPKFVLAGGARVIEQLQQSGMLPRSLGLLTVSRQAEQAKRVETVPGRPVASICLPTAERARQIVYAPDLNGRADPGEVVWTWVAFEEDAARGKDRPVLVVGRSGRTLLGLMMSSNPARADDPDWIGIGSGSWDGERRPSWVRLDRVLDVPEEGIRREGAVLERSAFDQVARVLCARYHWQ